MIDPRSFRHDQIGVITEAAREARGRALAAILLRLWARLSCPTADPVCAGFA